MQPITVVDAFTDKPFAGNPAAVCILERPDETWMLNVAREMNLSETAFLYPEADGYRLRWLTPAVEVELCGHATLASAHVLWEANKLRSDQPAIFHTRSGRLTATRRENQIALDFPAIPCMPCDPPPLMFESIGAIGSYVGKNGMDYLVEFANEDVIRGLTPNHPQLATLGARGVIVTGKPTVTKNIDFVSRFFAPGSGIDEDPVTGSAHCALGPYWAAKLNKNELRGYQASARGGYVGVEVRGDRVTLLGHAVTVWRGEIIRS